MTLPFRRRHHDDEGSHDRARALTSEQMLEPLGADDASWLARHLDACAECRTDREAMFADRAMLRSLRDRTPEPPRDLWARTSAAIEREAGSRRRRPARAPRRRSRSLPFGAAAGALLVLVVIGASIVPRIVPPTEHPGGTNAVADNSPDSQPTPFDVIPGAGRLAWLRPAANGAWELVTAQVDAVCPRARPSCAPLTEDDPGRSLSLAGIPTGVTISPTEDQLVVQARGSGTTVDKIYVVDVPPATPPATQAPTEAPTGSGTPTEPPPTPDLSSPGPSPTAEAILEIASGVTVVGEAAYEPADGDWLAFSARPSDGTTGPDLYLWHVGDATAQAVTTDHRTYFSTWLDGRILASSVELSSDPAVSGARSTDAPTAGPTSDTSDEPGKHADGHPVSFLLDPETLARTDIAQPDVWLPVVDDTGHFATYWSGTLVPTGDGLDWELGKGALVLSGWSDGHTAGSSPEPTSASPEPTAAPGLGPTGTPVAVVQGHSASFKAKFDPSSTRLAIWVGEQRDSEVGRLHLVVLDPSTGAVTAGPEPLPGAPALRRFSIDLGRLAWVSPSGQDGQESTVQVLGWSSTSFGEIRTIPAKALYIVR